MRTIEKYVQEHFDDSDDEYDVTPSDLDMDLWNACEAGETESLKELIDLGADINTKDYSGRSCIYIACTRGHFDVVVILLNEGASIEVENCRESPLHAACTGTSTLLVELLLDHGCNIETSSAMLTQHTVLQIACAEQHIAIATILLDHGAGIETTGCSIRPCTPLDFAAAMGRTEIAALLLERGASLLVVKDDEVSFENPLLQACANGHLELATILLDRGATVDASSGPVRFTPLHMACKIGHVDIISLLLDRGADIEGVVNGSTPLGRTCLQGHVSAASLLLDRGADLSAGGSSQGTLLHRVCRKTRQKTAYTVDYFALLPVAFLLISHGANPHTSNDRGESSVDIINEVIHKTKSRSIASNLRIARLQYIAFQERGWWTALVRASWLGEIKTCLALISGGAKFTKRVRDVYGTSPFRFPALSREDRQAGILAMADLLWQRRGPLVGALVGSGFLPRSAFDQLARLTLDFSAQIDPVVLDTSEKKWLHLLGLVLSNHALLRYVVSFL